MTIVETLQPMLGAWQGVNLLRLLPTDEFRSSAATATVSVTGRQFVTIVYTWSGDDKPQDGLMLVGESGAVWVDSWHTPMGWMELSREPDENGLVRLAGVYEKQWGWLIHLEPAAGPGRAKITMLNVPPGHPPYPAVEITLST